MNDRADDPAVNGVEPGKRLIRLSGEPRASLSARLGDAFQWLRWRAPSTGFRLKGGRHPLKLIAVPEDPVPGEIQRGETLLGGQIRFRGEAHAIEQLNPGAVAASPVFAEYLHSFAWLRDLSTVATRAEGAPIAQDLMVRWIGACGEQAAGVAWRPDLWGRRIQFWTAHAPLILSSTDGVYRSKVLNALVRGARHLERAANRAPAGSRRVAAWCGVITAGLLMAGGDARRRFGERGLARALTTGLTEEGGVIGRSPETQREVVEMLAMLRKAYAARRLELPAFANDALAAATSALLGVCHGDKGLASWQGAAPVPGDRVAQVIAASGVRARPLREAGDWGYQRLSAAAAVLIVDAAPPPATLGGAGGCASTLAFELSDGDTRIIVSCGGADALTAAAPAALAKGLRTTAAHSTLVLADSNSTAIQADGTLGRGVVEVALSRQETETASRIEASHDGYARRFGFVHRRQLVLAADGRELRGEDALLRGRQRRWRRAKAIPFAIRFHLGRGIEASPTADGRASILRLPGGALWQFRAQEGTLSIEPSLWIDRDGRVIPTQQLVVSGEAEADGAKVEWLLKRAR